MAGYEKLHEQMLVNMIDDDIKETVTSDNLILEYGKRLCGNYGHIVHRQTYISQKLREFGRFLLAIKDENVYTLEQSLYPENLEAVSKRLRLLLGFPMRLLISNSISLH